MSGLGRLSVCLHVGDRISAARAARTRVIFISKTELGSAHFALPLRSLFIRCASRGQICNPMRCRNLVCEDPVEERVQILSRDSFAHASDHNRIVLSSRPRLGDYPQQEVLRIELKEPDA